MVTGNAPLGDPARPRQLDSSRTQPPMPARTPPRGSGSRIAAASSRPRGRAFPQEEPHASPPSADMATIRQPLDFIAANAYGGRRVTALRPGRRQLPRPPPRRRPRRHDPVIRRGPAPARRRYSATIKSRARAPPAASHPHAVSAPVASRGGRAALPAGKIGAKGREIPPTQAWRLRSAWPRGARAPPRPPSGTPFPIESRGWPAEFQIFELPRLGCIPKPASVLYHDTSNMRRSAPVSDTAEIASATS